MFEKILSRSQLYLAFFGPRTPEPGTIFLRQNRVYILPTRPGLAYALALDHWMASGAVDLEDRMPAVLADVAGGLDPAPSAVEMHAAFW